MSLSSMYPPVNFPSASILTRLTWQDHHSSSYWYLLWNKAGLILQVVDSSSFTTCSIWDTIYNCFLEIWLVIVAHCQSKYRKPHLKWSGEALQGSSDLHTTHCGLCTPSGKKEGNVDKGGNFLHRIYLLSLRKERKIPCCPSIRAITIACSQWEIALASNSYFSAINFCSEQPQPSHILSFFF